MDLLKKQIILALFIDHNYNQPKRKTQRINYSKSWPLSHAAPRFNRGQSGILNIVLNPGGFPLPGHGRGQAPRE
jgi:hypothetical protein